METLLATLLAGHGSDENVDFDAQSPVELGLLCSAVRSCDHEVFLAQRFENHWRSQNLNNIRPALCKQAPHSFCSRVALDEPLQLAGQLSVPPEHRGLFLLEHAAAQLPHDADERVERMAYLTSRWRAGSSHEPSRPSGWTFPVTQDADAPELKFHVLSAAQLAPARNYLDAPSPGALAAARLLQVAGRADLTETLFFLEDSSPGVRSLGTEIQVPFLPERMLQSLPWKQALRALGIPSPRRPEFRTMVEAAFPPSKSYHPQVLLPLLLERLGLFTERVDVALHLPFSGDLGEDVRYLLFAQQFINEPKVHPAPQRMARLMSKGFAHQHADALPVEGLRHDGRRTELRSYRFGCLGPDFTQPLQRQFIDDIIETWLLITARDADLPALQQVWRDYCECVAGIAASNAPVFNRLLECDWYEFTQEPCDEDFTRKLPIVQAWNDVKDWLRIDNRRDEFRAVFKKVRTTAASRALALLQPGDVPANVPVQWSRCGAPFLDLGSASAQTDGCL